MSNESSNDDYDDIYHYDVKLLKQSEIYGIIIGVISALFTISVVFILLYKYDKLVKGRTLIHYILMIAIADTIVSMTVAMGYPKRGSYACAAQGFLNIFFSRLSLFFTCVLIIQLYSVIIYRKYLFKIRHMHCIVWTINIILQFIPFIDDIYYGLDRARNEIQSSDTRCLIGSNNYKKSFIWSIAVIEIPLLISFLIVFTFTLMTLVKSRYMIKSYNDNSNLVSHIKDSGK